MDQNKIRSDYKKDHEMIYKDESLNRVEKSLALKELVHMSICQVINDLELFFTRPSNLTPEEVAEKNKQEAKAFEASMNGKEAREKLDCIEREIIEFGNQKERLDKEKGISIRVSKFKESSMEYTIWVWVLKEDYLNTKFDLLENLKNQFDQDGIVIPYNQLDIHIDKG